MLWSLTNPVCCQWPAVSFFPSFCTRKTTHECECINFSHFMLLGINLEWNLCSANNNEAFLRVTPRFGSVPNFAFSLASSCPLLEQVKINNCPVISENTNSNWKEFKHFNKPINGLLTSTFTNDFSELLEKKKLIHAYHCSVGPWKNSLGPFSTLH